MSKSDFDKYIDKINARTDICFSMVAITNSLKIMFNPDNLKEDYIWIDPPWIILDNQSRKHMSSDECPLEEKEFISWCEKLKPVRAQKIISVKYDKKLGTVIECDNQYTLIIKDFVDNNEFFEHEYDNFYYK